MSGRDAQDRHPAGPAQLAHSAHPAGWDHPAYLRTAWALLREHPFHDAIPRIRVAAPAAADHATLALAWARLVDAAIAGSGAGTDFESFLAAHPELADADHVLAHYSPERLSSPRARREFVLPDRAPLPAPSRRDERGLAGLRDAGTKTVRKA